ncbi:MAG: hypothetical protein WBX01_14870, partial [Nitrososphaeraceae archaeon]
EKSTPVTSDINTSQKKVQYSLAFSAKHSLLITQLREILLRNKARSLIPLGIRYNEQERAIKIPKLN